MYFEAGVERILVHYPPIGVAKWERLANLAASGLDLTVAVDSLESATGLSDALKRRGVDATLLVELDVGLHRTGKTTAAAALSLAQRARLAARRVGGGHQRLSGNVPRRRRNRGSASAARGRADGRDPRRIACGGNPV